MTKPLSSVIGRPCTLDYNEDGCCLILVDRDTHRIIASLTIESLKDEDGDDFHHDFGEDDGLVGA